jgi:hypothetical protein
MAATAAPAWGERSTEKSRDEPTKFRVQKACPGQVGNAGSKTWTTRGCLSVPSGTTVLGDAGIAPAIDPPGSRLPRC